MDFAVENIQENIVQVARKIGYVIIDTAENGQYNLVRKLSLGNYPRFHIYAQQQGRNLNISLHLDQKAPRYEGGHAHAGEYAYSKHRRAGADNPLERVFRVAMRSRNRIRVFIVFARETPAFRPGRDSARR